MAALIFVLVAILDSISQSLGKLLANHVSQAHILMVMQVNIASVVQQAAFNQKKEQAVVLNVHSR